jgi:ABC-type Mn2+/Zn2+ transport system ATPase subunit
VSLKGDMTVLMVSHDSDQVRRIADRVTTIAVEIAPSAMPS